MTNDSRISDPPANDSLTVPARRRMLVGSAGAIAAAGLTTLAAAATDKPHHASGPVRENHNMNMITVRDGTQIYYKDWGQGQPVVFSHGWPLSSDAWESQMFFLASHGYRCIAHDRRGHGRGSVEPAELPHIAAD